MDELVREMERFKDLTSAFTLADVTLVLALSCILSMATAAVYRHTHRGTSYSQSFAQTLVLMGMVTALIMLVIGSNIARAFSLVGALSVIRFRNAVKETRDVGFMFMTMAIGMAVGTRFYLLGVIATAILSAVIVFMYRGDLFARRVTERLVRIRMPPGVDHERRLEPVFRELLDDHRLVSVEAVAGGALEEVVFTVVLRAKVDNSTFIEKVRAVNDNNRVVLVVGQQDVDL